MRVIEKIFFQCGQFFGCAAMAAGITKPAEGFPLFMSGLVILLSSTAILVFAEPKDK